MGWIAFALSLLLTPIWIAYAFSTGASPKVAFIPPAVALIALGFVWLWKKFVVLVAGEAEPRSRGKIQQSPADRGVEADLVFRPKRSFHPVWGLALPESGTIRMALIAAAGGACVGAAVALDWSPHERAVATRETASRPIVRSDGPISVRTEEVKSPPLSAGQAIQDSSPAASSAATSALHQAEVQAAATPHTESSSDQPPCDVALCERRYRSFRSADCTYQPFEGPRQYCGRQ